MKLFWKCVLVDLEDAPELGSVLEVDPQDSPKALDPPKSFSRKKLLNLVKCVDIKNIPYFRKTRQFGSFFSLFFS